MCCLSLGYLCIPDIIHPEVMPLGQRHTIVFGVEPLHPLTALLLCFHLLLPAVELVGHRVLLYVAEQRLGFQSALGYRVVHCFYGGGSGYLACGEVGVFGALLELACGGEMQVVGLGCIPHIAPSALAYAGLLGVRLFEAMCITALVCNCKNVCRIKGKVTKKDSAFAKSSFFLWEQ